MADLESIQEELTGLGTSVRNLVNEVRESVRVANSGTKKAGEIADAVTELDDATRRRIDTLGKTVGDGLDAIAASLAAINERLDKLEKRLTATE